VKLLREFFPIPLIIFGGLMVDLANYLDPEIITIQIIAWTSVIIGGIGLARIVWNKVRWLSNS
jgi:hypothetical protein|tara:strand:- start:87 stop:275 length:189 start_codon:yes stop_codon:yes gene_type:complete